MSKRKPDDSSINIYVVGYLVFCAWWQYKFVYPPIKEGDYSDAFNIFMGLNPLWPFWGYVLMWLIGGIAGWVMKVWVFLFGE